MKILIATTIVLCSALMSGCASSRVKMDPGKITLEEAMGSVGKGLKNMKEEQENSTTGLVPSEMSVTFNLSASATDEGKLYVETTSIPVSGGQIRIGGEHETEVEFSRGNQITIEFKNILFTDDDELVSEKDADDLAALLKALENSGK